MLFFDASLVEDRWIPNFLSERGWVKGDFKVSIDSEFVFRNRLIIGSKRQIVMFKRSSRHRSSSDHGL